MAIVRNLAWPGAVTTQTGVQQVHIDPVITDGAEADTYYDALAAGPSYNDDAAAAIGGVAIGERYRNGNFLMVRLT